MRLVAALIATSLMSACASKLQKEANIDSGARLYLSLCASCHGAGGKGDGPVAASMVTAPPDLTKIAERRNGFFVASELHRIIDGRETRAAHGTRDMPIWGNQLYFSAFKESDVARAEADARIDWIIEYLRTIQAPKK